MKIRGSPLMRLFDYHSEGGCVNAMSRASLVTLSTLFESMAG